MSEAPRRLPQRATDRIEELVAWILTTLALLVIGAACMIGLTVHDREAERVDAGTGSTSPVRAVLLEDATATIGEYGAHQIALVPARWTDRTGLEHDGTIAMSRSAPAGTEVVVWTDAAGRITAPPLRRVNALFSGIVAAIGVLCAGATLLVATWLGVQGVTRRFNSRRWERGWARVEPLWRRSVL